MCLISQESLIILVLELANGVIIEFLNVSNIKRISYFLTNSNFTPAP